MNPTCAETTASTIFVVHLWREWMGTEWRWRGHIEHVQSGQQAGFLCVNEMIDFLQQMGVTIAPRSGGHETLADLFHMRPQEEL